jgi:hypothetical protein
MTPKQVIDSELTKARTDLARSRHQREAMAIAKARDELIEKSFVARQAQYIFITLRQGTPIARSPRRRARRKTDGWLLWIVRGSLQAFLLDTGRQGASAD